MLSPNLFVAQSNINSDSTHFKSATPTFTAWNRYVLKDGDIAKLSHRNDTSFARCNRGVKKYWEDLIDYLAKKYGENKNVNVYFYGCSDGSESGTYVMTVLSRQPKEIAENLLRNIKAVDFDRAAIDKANSNTYEINKHEITRLRELLGDKVYDYFLNFPKNDVLSAKVKLSDIVTSKIYYEHADVMDDVKNINGDNNIVFAKSFWSYLEDKVSLLAKNMRDNIGENSTLILSSFDRASCAWQGINIDKLLNKCDFKSPNLDLVFEK